MSALDLAELAEKLDATSLWLEECCEGTTGIYDDKDSEIVLFRRAASTIRSLVEERDELRRTFDLRWAADQRAIALWQALNPGNDLTWPDRADMVVWLLEKLDAIEMSEVTGWPWPSETTLDELAKLSGRDRDGATQLAIDLGKTFGVPAGFAAHHYIADQAVAQLQASQARVTELEGAGQAVVARWDTPLWKDVEPTANVINRLRSALSTSGGEEGR